MSDPGEQVRARTAVDGRGPADDVRAPAEQREDLPVPGRGRAEGRRQRATRGPRPVSARPNARRCRRHVPDAAGRPAGMPARCPVHRPVFREAGPVDVMGIRRCRLPRGRGGWWRDPQRSRISSCRRNSRPGAIRRVAEVVGQLARRVPATGGLRRILPQKGKSGDRRGDRRSRRRRRRQCPGEIADPSGSVVSRRPLVAERLRGRVAVEAFAGPVEPAPDPDVIVCAAKVANEEGEKVEPGCDRVRGWSGYQKCSAGHWTGRCRGGGSAVPLPGRSAGYAIRARGAGDWSRASLIFSRSVESRAASEQGIR